MTPKNKSIIKVWIISGLVYAILQAGFDYRSGEGFKILKFLFNLLFFGGIMALISRASNTNKKNRLFGL